MLNSTNKPLLLVDVDGVINALSPLPFATEQEFRSPEGFEIRVPSGTSARLTRLEKLFECIWASTWEHSAYPDIGQRLGVHPWPVIEFNRPVAGATWKLKDVRDYVAERPLAWVDDELYADARTWAKSREAQGIPTLLVHADAAAGLSEQNVITLEQWVENLSSV